MKMTSVRKNIENTIEVNSNKEHYPANSSKGKWSLPLHEVYTLALSFYKEKEGKAIQLSYEHKLQLVAYTQQVSHGAFSKCTNHPPIGALDVVGRDRRIAWQKLGNMSTTDARVGFVSLLSQLCPLFDAYVEAHRRDKEGKAHKVLLEAKKTTAEDETKRTEDQKRLKDELAQRKIRQALNEQTYEQFCIYADQQYPGDPERQGDLVKQLQEQHFLQYMQQLQSNQSFSNSNCEEATNSNDSNEKGVTDEYEFKEEEAKQSAVSMWTMPDIQTFKETISANVSNGVMIRVSHGETVTVRVPTSQSACRLFWEFATDHYDIGFGVYFEWGTPKTDQVTVHVSESDDEDDLNDDDLEDDEYLNALEKDTIGALDLEKGKLLRASEGDEPPLSEVIPLYRRDCHLEVYVGSHIFPGEGVYLLKFDNSYSLWRSKNLYYRIYYTNC